MRQIRTIISISAVTAVALWAAIPGAAAADHARHPTQTIVETAASAGKFKTLTTLLKRAGLVKALEGKGPYTVFAPTDTAFAKVPKATLARLARNRAALRSVLLFHVAKGRLTAAKVTKRHSVTTLNGQRLAIRVRGANVFVGGARVVTARRDHVERRHPRHQQGPDPPLAPARLSVARRGSPRRATSATHPDYWQSGKAVRLVGYQSWEEAAAATWITGPR